MEAFCKTCGSVQEVEGTESFETDGQVYCLSCGDEFAFAVSDAKKAAGDEDNDDKYAHYKIGRIMHVEAIPKSKDLKLCRVDVIGNGKEEDYLPIVTNAKYAEAGWKVVIATIGAIVPAGATVTEDPEAIEVTKRNVQGVESRGMICDCFMLRWTGGAKGIIQQVPDSYQVGDRPPDARPRM